MITYNDLVAIRGGEPRKLTEKSNLQSIVKGLESYGRKAELDKPHYLAHYLSQLFHESGAGRYDQEIASGAAYEGRKDLGNTKKGDGVKFKGRSPIQLTGRFNYTRFTEWAKQNFDNSPDFVEDPEAINSDPWEGLVPIWFWTVGNSTGRSLNRLAASNNGNAIEDITRRVNGGHNGLADRKKWYDRSALVLLGYRPDDVKGFQRANGLKVDGISGDKTRAAMHKALYELGGSKGKFAISSVTEKIVPSGIKSGTTATGFGVMGQVLTDTGNQFMGMGQGIQILEWVSTGLLIGGMMLTVYSIYKNLNEADYVTGA